MTQLILHNISTSNMNTLLCLVLVQRTNVGHRDNGKIGDTISSHIHVENTIIDIWERGRKISKIEWEEYRIKFV